MICPFRIDTLYNHSTISGTVVCTSKREVYSPCMGHECPAYVDMAMGVRGIVVI